MPKPTFPKDFLWGASTSAHQVEGHNHNQWTEWEKANAEHLADTAEQRLGWLPNWQDMKAEAENPDNYISGTGIEHYTRFKDDFKLLKQLHMNAFRFGIEWSRIEPEEGKWDQTAIKHYRQYIQELKKLGIEPIPTLWHWTMPVWFVAKGGFEKRQNISYFERFVEKFATEFGDQLHYVIILNEPNAYIYHGYVTGQWPPQSRNVVKGLWTELNLVRAHHKGYKILKASQPNLQIGIAYIVSALLPIDAHNLVNRLVAKLRMYTDNWWFLERTKQSLDFIGLNYYFTSFIDWRGQTHNPTKPVNDLGWYMDPSGIGPIIQETWKRYRKPIIITENGLADAHDKQRIWWLERTLDAMRQAIREGVDLRGYLHWSLLDNFEWAYGWWPKFGLVAVDRRTMKRTLRPSATWLAKHIKALKSSG